MTFKKIFSASIMMLLLIELNGNMVAKADTPHLRSAESICSRGDIIICEDFENLTTNQTSTGWYDWNTVSPPVPQIVDTTFSRTGSRSLKFTIPNSNTGELQPGLVRHNFPSQAINTGNTIYVRLYVYWQPGFVFNPGGSGSKFFYFNSWSAGGDNQWRMRWAYQNVSGDTTKARLEFDAEPIDDVHGVNQPNPIYFTAGQWYLVELYTKLNTPGQSDGEVKWWVNGALQGSYTNWSVRGSHTEPINGISIDEYFGGAEVYPHNQQSLWFDDLVVSSNPIGPMNNNAVPPAAPMGLTVK